MLCAHQRSHVRTRLVHERTWRWIGISPVTGRIVLFQRDTTAVDRIGPSIYDIGSAGRAFRRLRAQAHNPHPALATVAPTPQQMPLNRDRWAREVGAVSVPDLADKCWFP